VTRPQCLSSTSPVSKALGQACLFESTRLIPQECQISPHAPIAIVIGGLDNVEQISGAFGRSCSSIDQDNGEVTRIDAMSSVYEQHPNLSVSNTEDELTPLPSSSANPSQSISRKSKTLFRRTSNDFNVENERPSSLSNLPGFPKKLSRRYN